MFSSENAIWEILQSDWTISWQRLRENEAATFAVNLRNAIDTETFLAHTLFKSTLAKASIERLGDIQEIQQF